MSLTVENLLDYGFNWIDICYGNLLKSQILSSEYYIDMGYDYTYGWIECNSNDSYIYFKLDIEYVSISMYD